MTTPVYHHRHLVTFDETNLVGNVYFAHYLHWQGHCRERFLLDHAPGVLKAVQSGDLAMVTVSCAMDYYAESFGLDVIDVGMTLRGKGANRVEMDFQFCRDDVTVAVGRQTVACMRRDGDRMVPVPVPEELARAVELFAP